MARIALLLLTILSISVSVFASSASAQSFSETAGTGNTPWLSISLSIAAVGALYFAMSWGDKRESYKR